MTTTRKGGPGGQRKLKSGAPRIWRRHDGARGVAYNRAWLALVTEYGKPPVGSLLALDMARLAAALVHQGQTVRDLEASRRAVERGGRGRGRADLRRLELRHQRADQALTAARETLDRVTGKTW